jgi:uncharacterized protein (DUF1697 family)
MARYAAFLRGVSPQNLRMPAFGLALQAAGFSHVRTLLSSGNAVFETRAKRSGGIERSIERALEQVTGRSFKTFVRSAGELDRILAATNVEHPAGTKRVVVFHRGAPRRAEAIPVHGASWALLGAVENEAYGFYTPGPGASSLMARLKQLYGDDFTTRTADTVLKCTTADPLR